MLYTTSTMANQVGEYDAVNTLLLTNSVSVKEEVCQDEDFVDDKVNVCESAIIIDNCELQDNLIFDKMKLGDVFTTLDNIKSELTSTNVQYNTTHATLKIEEETKADDIKIEFNNRLLYCEDCQAYREDYCAQCKMLVHIMNKTVPINTDNRLQEELPNDNILEIRDHFGQLCIFALKVIPAGVRFGRFIGMNTIERPWKIKGGKFVVNKDKSKYLNWMQYISPARNISEQNLQVFQYDHNLYYESTRQIEEGHELLVYFGEEYDDSLNRNVEMDFIPTTQHIFKDAFACTFCCLGFSSKSYLAKHKTVCLENAVEGFSIEELTQCPSCKIHLDQKEYLVHHKAYCYERNNRECILPDNQTTDVDGRKRRPCQIYKCQQCKYRTKYKGDLKNHANLHREVKMNKCGICGRRFKTKEILQLHVENTHISGGVKEDSEDITGDYINGSIKTDHSFSQDEVKQFRCSLCEFRTKYKISLRRHTKVKHLKEFNYRCDICNYKANLRLNLKHHIKTRHLKEFKYKCATCDYKTNWKTALKDHIETRHLKEFKYECETCDYKTNKKGNLKAHIEAKHLREFKYKCDTCDYKANNERHLKRHLNTKHLNVFKYKCDICDYKTNQACSLKTHIETRHLKEFKFKCETCDYGTNNKGNLEYHIDTRHSKEFKYKCGTCDYKSHKQWSLKIHIETKHQNEFKYKCDTCQYKTNYKYRLKSHIEAIHLREFKYKCDSCDYKGNNEHHLRRHINTKHLKVFKYRCDTCDYKTNQTGSLKIHIETRHLKEFKFKCDRCEYKSNHKSSLKRHVDRKHLKEFKYECDPCDYKGNDERHLKKHKVFKYKCDTCDYKSHKKCSLRIHIETKHRREFEYKCDTCDYKSNYKSSLKRHVEARHLKEYE